MKLNSLVEDGFNWAIPAIWNQSEAVNTLLKGGRFIDLGGRC